MSHTPPAYHAGPQTLGDLAAGASREWLLADGLGGYAMGTLSGLRTRRYHGLLVTAGSHPGDRRVALAALDPTVRAGGATYQLGVHEWASGAIAPAGHTLLESFTLDGGLPVWRWRMGETVLERRLATAHGRPVIAAVHRLLSGPPVRLTLAALGTWRDAHGERHATGPAPVMREVAGGVVVEDAYRLSGPGFAPDGRWYFGARLREEAARGLPDTEDLWSIGTFNADLAPGEALEVLAWAGDLADPPPPAAAVVEAAAARHRRILAAARTRDGIDAALALAADAFVVTAPSRGPSAAGTRAAAIPAAGIPAGGPDVVAGYPWFGCWGRDTMIAYEGLFLTANRADLGREVLRGYAAGLSAGMLANAAGAPGAPVDYHSVDAPLWLIHATGQHVAATGDTDLAAELLPALRSVVDAYTAGTRFGIRPTAGGLITAGAPDTALTWMDARVGGAPVTSRWGSPVEVNALWINALGTLDALAGTDAYRRRRSLAVEAFAAAYAARPGTGGGLADVVRPGTADAAIRPNQVLAYALPFGPLHGEPVPDVVGTALLTPAGLRTLAPADPAYRGAHRGDPAERDSAYHQGTVWPWLLGPYVAARAAAGQPVAGLLDGIAVHLGEYGIGSVSETLYGDPPHVATGCPFQAWSVAQAWTAYRAVSAAAHDGPRPAAGRRHAGPR